MNPVPATLVLKVVSIDDLGVNIVELPHGNFLVDGEVVSNTGYGSYNKKHQIAAKDVENVRSISTRNILEGYVPTTEGITDDVLSVEAYNDLLQELHQNGQLVGDEDDEDQEFVWNTLEDEFAFRKFKS